MCPRDWDHLAQAASRHRWSTRTTRSAARRQSTPQTIRAAPRWSAGAAKPAARELPTPRFAAAADRGRWTAASSSVLAAPIEEISWSKPSAHARNADTVRSDGALQRRARGERASWPTQPAPLPKRLRPKRAAGVAPLHDDSPLTGIFWRLAKDRCFVSASPPQRLGLFRSRLVFRTAPNVVRAESRRHHAVGGRPRRRCDKSVTLYRTESFVEGPNLAGLQHDKD